MKVFWELRPSKYSSPWAMTTKPLEVRLTIWQFFVKTYGLFYITLVAPCWLSAQAVQECIENQLTNSYVKSVA